MMLNDENNWMYHLEEKEDGLIIKIDGVRNDNSQLFLEYR